MTEQVFSESFVLQLQAQLAEQAQTIERLRAERDARDERLKLISAREDEWVNKARIAQDRVERLTKALQDYGMHQSYCGRRAPLWERPCTCGFDAALSQETPK